MLVAFIAGCGGGNSGGGGSGGSTGGNGTVIDMAVFQSACGHPGDKGNSKGVGEFCQSFDQCDKAAAVCSVLNNGSAPPAQQTFFCTKACTAGGDVMADCGENAVCLSNALGAACVPVACAPKDMM